jgi:hypothetical protein
MTSAHQVCDLAAGQLTGWTGLDPFRLEAAPACLGPAEREGWLDLGRGATPYRVCRTIPDRVEVWLFHPPGEAVCLVEVYPPAGESPVGTLLDSLGEPDLRYEYPLAGRLQRMLGRSGEGLDERVYGGRGLAVAVTHGAGREERLFRLRGFRPTRAEEYFADFVDLPGPRFLEE